VLNKIPKPTKPEISKDKAQEELSSTSQSREIPVEKHTPQSEVMYLPKDCMGIRQVFIPFHVIFVTLACEYRIDIVFF